MTKSPGKHDHHQLIKTWLQFFDPQYDFSVHSTKELLAFLRGPECRSQRDLHNIIKTELSKRPNIPTKAQAKAKRKELAKSQRNR